jgi:hypothetical protein
MGGVRHGLVSAPGAGKPLVFERNMETETMSAARITLVALTFLAAACAADSTEVDRGPLGKADSVGSCAGSDCDGQADGGNCFCDADCSNFGDCCGDFVEVCEAPSAAPCGGFAGVTCSEGSYCHFEQEQTCGAADQLGVCVELPQACIEIFAPVCGCDGETYGNSCFAAAAGVSVVDEGECAGPEIRQCGGLAGLQCAEGEFCDFDIGAMCGAADQLGTCKSVPELCATVIDPVCGCDGATHNNACEANRAGVSVATSGACI